VAADVPLDFGERGRTFVSVRSSSRLYIVKTMFMRIRSLGVPLLVGAAIAMGPLPARADDAGTSEIQHIIAFVRDSSCTFIRNGSDYASSAAADHIAMKAGYAGSKIKDGDTLIDLVASKSSMSGKPYYVQCPGQAKTESAVWLHGELDRFRAFKTAGVIPKT
jgi:hypothetical protein